MACYEEDHLISLEDSGNSMDPRNLWPEPYNTYVGGVIIVFAAVRSRQPVVEDPVFGFRATDAALLANVSFERRSVVEWNSQGR
jgi:hypothetical protein